MSDEDIFPITEAESDALHALGWQSGFGWSDQFDWFRTPSAGPAEWVEDRPELRTMFLNDLSTVRRIHRDNRVRELVSDHARDIVGCLQECSDYFDDLQDVNWEGDGPNREMSLKTEIDSILAQVNAE